MLFCEKCIAFLKCFVECRPDVKWCETQNAKKMMQSERKKVPQNTPLYTFRAILQKVYSHMCLRKLNILTWDIPKYGRRERQIFEFSLARATGWPGVDPRGGKVWICKMYLISHIVILKEKGGEGKRQKQ